MTREGDVIDVNQWQTEFVKHMIVEIFRQIEIQEETHGIEFANKAALSILASYVSTLVSVNLSEKATEVNKSFAVIKEHIAQAVALGTETGTTGFYRSPVPHYCMIRPVPEPVNKVPC